MNIQDRAFHSCGQRITEADKGRLDTEKVHLGDSLAQSIDQEGNRQVVGCCDEPLHDEVLIDETDLARPQLHFCRINNEHPLRCDGAHAMHDVLRRRSAIHHLPAGRGRALQQRCKTRTCRVIAHHDVADSQYDLLTHGTAMKARRGNS